MAIEAKAKIVIRGGSEALKTIQGVSKGLDRTAQASQRAARQQEQAARKAAREQEQAAKRAAQVATREAEKAAAAVRAAEKTKEQAAIKAAREQERAAKQAAKAAVREAEKAARENARILARQTRDAQREAMRQQRAQQEAREAYVERRSKRIGLATAVTAGVLAGGATALSTARGIGGIRSADERIQAGNDFQQRLIRAGTAAGLDDAGIKAVQDKILAASQATGIDAGELLAGPELGQASFNDFKGFADAIGEIAKTAKASGASVEDLVGAMGFARQAFGLTAQESVEALNLMVAAGDKGSIELKNFAGDFAPVAGLFAQNTGMKGMAGFRQFVGVAQAGGTLGAGSAQTATMTERFVALLGDSEKMRKLKTLGGVDIKGKTPEQIINAMATSKKFNRPGVKHEIFGGDILGTNMITALISARNRALSDENAVNIGRIANLDATVGAQKTEEKLARLSKTGGFKLEQQAAEMQVDTIKNLETYNKQLIEVNKAGNYLEKSFRNLALWSGAITATGAAAAGATLAQRLYAGYGAGAAGAANAVGAAGSIASGAAATSSLASAASGAASALGRLTVAIPVALAAYQAATALGADKAGETLGNWLFDQLHPGRRASEDWRFQAPEIAKPVPVPDASTVAPASEQRLVLAELREMNRHLSTLPKIDADLAANLNRPGGSSTQARSGAPRP